MSSKWKPSVVTVPGNAGVDVGPAGGWVGESVGGGVNSAPVSIGPIVTAGDAPGLATGLEHPATIAMTPSTPSRRRGAFVRSSRTPVITGGASLR
jgi:hypothetical protein